MKEKSVSSCVAVQSACMFLAVPKNLPGGIKFEEVDKPAFGSILEAVKNNCKESLMYWIEQETDLETTDDNGATALHYAAFKGQGELLQILLDNGADADATNHT